MSLKIGTNLTNFFYCIVLRNQIINLSWMFFIFKKKHCPRNIFNWDYTFNLDVLWTVPLAEAGSLELSGHVYVSDSYYFQTTNRTEQDSMTLLSGQVMYRPINQRWGVSIWGKNLTDELYYLGVVPAAIGDVGYVAEPRTYGVKIDYQF